MRYCPRDDCQRWAASGAAQERDLPDRHERRTATPRMTKLTSLAMVRTQHEDAAGAAEQRGRPTAVRSMRTDRKCRASPMWSATRLGRLQSATSSHRQRKSGEDIARKPRRLKSTEGVEFTGSQPIHCFIWPSHTDPAGLAGRASCAGRDWPG